MRLMKILLNFGYKFWMDNCYNYLNLAAKLIAMGTHVCCTLLSNRKFVQKLVQETLDNIKLKRGEHVTYDNGTIMVGTWQD